MAKYPLIEPSGSSMSNSNKIRVWDLPTRLFHWLLAICVTGAYITIKLGGLWTDYHMLFGYATLGLILFRIIWGFVGTEHARFRNFVRGPRAIVAYLRGQTPYPAGHNPLGALSVVAMLALFGYQAVTGLFSNDDIASEGPLASRVSQDLSDTISGLHKLDEWPILILVGLHVAAILWYRLVKKQKLIRPMITGDAHIEDLAPDSAPANDTAAKRVLAAVIALLVAALVYWIVSLRLAAVY